MLGGIISVVMIAVVGLLFITRIANAAEPPDWKFTKIMPAPDTATQARDAHMEIAQVGEGNTLNAEATWGKYYFDPSKVANGYIGISKGGYGDQADTLGTSRGLSAQRFSDDGTTDKTRNTDAIKYEFFLAIDQVNQNRNFAEEIPCRAGGSIKPVASYVAYSNQMPVNGWYKLDAKRFVDNATCNGKRWSATQKTGKYVLFVRASWNTAAPVINGKTQGRVNAFKLGAAYAQDTAGDPLTGYWSNADWAYTSDEPTGPLKASYAVQDRLSPDATNGDYTFKFAPDCRLARGKTEARYLHWSDVDYPAYYRAPWPVQPAPEFDLVEISPAGKRDTVLSVGPGKNLFNGLDANGNPRQNIHNAIEYKSFKGGYTYEWVWKNIARIDGINFWIPYDDYPALNGGCGTYNQSVSLQGTRGSGWFTDNFEAAGGDKVTFMVTGKYVSGNSAAPTSTFGAHLVSQTNSPYDRTFTKDGPISISDDGYKKSGSRINLEWVKPGMGPSLPYVSQRDLSFTYQVKDDAQDGAKHCFNADLTPLRSANPSDSAYSKTICVTINNALKPFVNTAGGDVHAGDCSITTGALKQIYGNVSQSGSLGSSGTYVVSAGGAISQFGSGGTPLGSNLTLGKGGLYGDMCRPTFAEMAKEIKDPVQAPSVPETFDLSQVKAPGTILFPSSRRVTGTSKYRVTLYAPNGTVTIAGSTFGGDTANSYSRENLPVVGVLAQNIKIEPGVGTINAILYASLNIDTCAGQDIKTTGGVAACKSKLTLKGFAMAHDFSFKRTTGANGLNESERLQFSAAYYLNPPDGFKKAAGLVKYLGERAPLY